MSNKRRNNNGFSLVEMALVLFIVGLLAKSVVGPLVAVQEHGKRRQAQQQLQQIRQAVIGHLVAYGALPCPLDSRASAPVAKSAPLAKYDNSIQLLPGMASDACLVSDGFVDAYGMRIGGAVSDSGALLDPWGREFRYVVSLDSANNVGGSELPMWTTPGEASRVGLSQLSSNIVICSASPTNDCSGHSVRSDQIAFVVFTIASDDSSSGWQAENLDRDRYFVAAEESIVQGAEFDDLTVWGSVADVSYWLLRMGWLP